MSAARKIRMVCTGCGSENVRADAYAAWNVEAQQWEVAAVYDKGAWCDDCDGQSRIEEKPVEAVSQ